MRARFLPGARRTVSERLDDLGLHRIDLSKSAVLEKGCVYIVQLQERLALGERIGGFANPKSSTGRIDLFTRLIADHAVDFDAVPPGYAGPLYAEIFPRAFSVVVRKGSRLNQLRFVRGTPGITAAALRHLLARFLRFQLANGLISLLGNLALMRLLVGVLHLPVLWASLGAISVCGAVNFLASGRLVFVRRKTIGN